MDHRPPKKTYSDAMAQWAATREAQLSFFGRLRNRFFSTDPLSHPLTRLFGYFWRLLAVGLVAFVIWFFVANYHLTTEAFKKDMEAGTQKFLKAQSVEFNPFKWQSARLGTRSMKVQGGPESFYRVAEAEYVDIEVPITTLVKKDWTVPSVHIGSLIVDLKSGGIGSVKAPVVNEKERQQMAPEGLPAEIKAPSTSPISKPLELEVKKGGFGISPDFSTMNIGSVEASKALFTWGTSTATRGRVEGTSLTAAHHEGKWTVGLRGGSLTQNWLYNVPIRQLFAEVQSDALVFSQSELINNTKDVKTGGATIDGKINFGTSPALDLTVHCSQLSSNLFLDSELQEMLEMKVTGDVAFKGSLNQATGIHTSGKWKIESGILKGLPILTTLTIVTTRARFREIDIEKGSFEFNTQYVRAGVPRLEVKNLELIGAEDFRVVGNFVWEAGTYSGQIKIGMPKAFSERVLAPVKQAYFKESDASHDWVSVPLDGTQDTLTRIQSEEMAALHHKAAREGQ